jgi:hypothetical protein
MSQIRSFFAGCTAMATALTAVFLLTGAKTPTHARFDEITVGRIDVEEPDGTRRLIISNRSQFPGDFVKGQETARPDRRSNAGMLFINDEGTEQGGFIYRGVENADGKIDAGLSLTFDRFRQDQSLQLLHVDDERSSRSAVVINDSPFYKFSSIDDLHRMAAEAGKLPPAEQDAYFQRKQDEGRLIRNRIYLGTTQDESSSLTLKDAKGKPRMQLLVTAQGKAEIRMLDENGKVLKTVTPEN